MEPNSGRVDGSMETVCESDVDLEDRTERVLLEGRPPERFLLCFARAVWGGFAGFVLPALFVQFVLGKIPGEYTTLLYISAIAAMLVNVLRPADFGVRKIEIEQGYLFLTGPGCHVELAAGEVDTVVGRKQMSLDGGELLIWKTLWLTAGRERFAFHVDPKDAAGHFQELLEHCPNAVGIDAEPAIVLPAKAAGVSVRDWFADARGRARPALASMAWRYAARAVVASLAGCVLGVVYAVILLGGRVSDGFAKSFVYAAIAWSLGLLYVVHALQANRALRRGMSKLDRIEIDGSWSDQAGLARMKLRPPVRQNGPGSLIAKVLTLASLVLFLVPIVGLVVSGLGWLGLRNSTSSLGVLAKTLLILSVVVSVSFVAVLLI